MTKNENEKIKQRYNRVSRVYDWLEKPMEAMTSNEWRDRMMDQIEGREVLEVGVGTGKNLPHYPENLEVTGIDFSEKMLEKARAKAVGLAQIELIEMDAQAMTFPDNTFDTVLTSCVFCSVPDPVAGLKEIRRVCKKGGKIIMLEHMRSQQPIVGKFMDVVNFLPLHVWGANINRRTIENLHQAGFRTDEIEAEDVWMDIVKFIEIRNRKESE